MSKNQITQSFFFLIATGLVGMSPHTQASPPSNLPQITQIPEESTGDVDSIATDQAVANPEATEEPPAGPQQEYLIEIQGIRKYPQWLDFETKVLELIPKRSSLRKYKVSRGSYLVWVKTSISVDELRNILSTVRIQDQNLRFPQTSGVSKADSGETIVLRVGVP